MVDPRIKRISIVALIFIASALYHMISHKAEILLRSLQQDNSNFNSYRSPEEEAIINVPRLQYVRPPGNPFELLGILEELSSSSSTTQSSSSPSKLPKTAREIANKYGIPETSRDVVCDDENDTTIGWIPAENNNNTITNSGRIPRLIFQSWKSTQLQGPLCSLILSWSVQNPQYDYFLFDDDAMDNFIRLEYGREIFSSYACVKTGAAKCDVWRLLVVYLFGGVYFDADVKPLVPLEEWDWGEERDVVTARSCTSAPRKHPGGCAHQWGLIYAPQHPVIYAAIKETLTNLAERKAKVVYDISFWSYYNAWRQGPYNQSYMPGWGEAMGGRVLFQDDGAKEAMVEDNGHWQKAKEIWHYECMEGNTPLNAQ